MSERATTLGKLGWTDWFEERAAPYIEPQHTVARVVAVDREQPLLIDETGTFRAKLPGAYGYHHDAVQQLPCVGDWVCAKKSEPGGLGIIHSVLERRTLLRRKAVGSARGMQLIAANVDCVFIVQSCHFDFNLKRLERYLVMVADGGAEARILLTKTDLVDASTLASERAQLEAARITAPTLTLSRITGEGLDELKQLLQPGKTYCFVGSSGVGKSTLINALMGRELLETAGVSASGEGRHTTVRRELIVLENGALVIDNPGMREFGILPTESGIDAGFVDITALAANCRFRDCNHTNEPGCSVVRALEAREIDAEHYANFVKLQKESAQAQLTAVEKHKKDRVFGRMMKSYNKNRDRE